MNLFNNYCYPDISSAALAEISAPAQQAQSVILTGKNFSVVDDTTVNMVYHVSPLTGLPAYDVVHVRIFPTCTQVGYLTNISGLSLADVTEISFGVILVWATAFAFRAMIRPTGVRL
jgi:hypothetical protein